MPAHDGKIRFSCTCGARMSAPTGSTGRRARCPNCKTILIVPASDGAASVSTASGGDGARADAGASPGDFGASLLSDLAAGQALARSTIAPPPPTPVRTDEDRLYGLSPLESKTRGVDETRVPQGPPKTCPSCHAQLPHTAKICITCGIDLKTGRAILMKDDDHLDHAYIYAERIIRWISWLFFFGIYPIASEAFGTRKPWVVRGIALATTVISLWYMVTYLYNDSADPGWGNLMLWSDGDWDVYIKESGEDIPPFLLDELRDQTCKFHAYQLVTHAFLHGDIIHLAGNMLFLMVLGSRVNALIGNLLTVLLYPLLAACAAWAHFVSVQNGPPIPMLGASGAVMGLAGMYFILMPSAHVHMAAWFRWGLIGGFQLNLKLWPVRGIWVVLFYIAFDVVYTALGAEDGVAHWAHLGGFLCGAVFALILLFSRLVNARGGDLFSWILGPYAWGLIGRPNRPAWSLW